MKKFFIIVLSLVIVLLFTACANDTVSRENSTSNSPATSISSDVPNEENIHIEIKDLQSNLNQWHRFALDITQDTDKYLTAEIYGAVLDGEGNVLGSTTAFVNNLGPSPTDWESIPFLAQGSSEYFADYKIVSYEFTDGFFSVPEITDDNVKDYLRLTTEDYGDSFNNEKEITVTLHNLTPNYFSGRITFIVKDLQGKTIKEKTEEYNNLNPYTESEKLLWFPIVEEYSLEYVVEEYTFSENLMQ